MSDARDAEEWVGGLVPSSPGYQTLLYFNRQGRLLAQYAVSEEFGFRWAGQWLRELFAHVDARGGVLPARVRVSSRELAAALRAELSDVSIVEAPTPEVTEYWEEALQRSPSTPHPNDDVPFEQQRSFYGVDLEDHDVAAHFAAVAELHRANWWNHVPLAGVIGAATVFDPTPVTRAVAVLQLESPPPLLFFDHGADFAGYTDALRAMTAGDDLVTMPPHLHLGFCTTAELARRSLDELSRRHGAWEIAALDAIPWLASVDVDRSGLSVRREDARFAALVALALVALIRDDLEAVRSAWLGGPSFARDLVVSYDGASIEVHVRIPWVGVDGPVLPTLVDMPATSYAN